jgi:hypothetical protein
MAFMKQLLLIYLLGMAVLFSADANAVQDTSSASADPKNATYSGIYDHTGKNTAKGQIVSGGP